MERGSRRDDNDAEVGEKRDVRGGNLTDRIQRGTCTVHVNTGLEGWLGGSGEE